MISNRPADVVGFIESMDDGWQWAHLQGVQLCLSYQSPVDLAIGTITRMCEDRGIDLVCQEREFRHGNLFHYGAAREHAWSMATGEYAYLVDDDFRFGSGTIDNPYPASKRIFDAIQFIGDDRRRVVQLNGFLGSNSALQSFVPMQVDMWSMNHGIILHHYNGRLIRHELLKPGACEDLSIFASLVANGWSPFKGFRSMIRTGKRKKIGETDNPNYDIDYLLSEGNIAAVRRHYPNFPIKKQLWSPK